MTDLTNHRIVRYMRPTGAVTGWFGKINAIPSSGSPACSGASVGSPGVGWCVGGASAGSLGPELGKFTSPEQMVWLNGTLYVVDSLGRVMRIQGLQGL